MITNNPFSILAETIPSIAMQIFVIAMGVLVVLGTLIDIIHKKNVKYFFENAKKAKKSAKKILTTGEKTAVVIKTIANDIATTSELGAGKRRVAHLFGMYGTILFWLGSVVMVFCYATPTSETPSVWPMIWHVGAIMTVLGGSWFWFFFKSGCLFGSSTLVQNNQSRFICTCVNSIFFVWFNMVIFTIFKFKR